MVRSSGRRRAGRFYVGLAIGGTVMALLATAAGPAAFAADGPPVTAIVTFKHKPGAAEKQAIKALGGKVRRAYGLINGLVVTLPANALAKARLGTNVKTVEQDATITALRAARGLCVDRRLRIRQRMGRRAHRHQGGP